MRRWIAIPVRAAAAMAGITVLFLLAQARLLLDKMFEVIQDAPSFGMLTICLVGALWGVVMLDARQDGNGYPFRGLLPWMLVSGPVYGVLAAVTTMIWRAISHDAGSPGTVWSELLVPGPAPLVVLLLGWTAVNLGLAAGGPIFMEISPLWLRLVSFVPFLGVLFAGGAAGGTAPRLAASAELVTAVVLAVILSAGLLVLSGIVCMWLRSGGLLEARRDGLSEARRTAGSDGRSSPSRSGWPGPQA